MRRVFQGLALPLVLLSEGQNEHSEAIHLNALAEDSRMSKGGGEASSREMGRAVYRGAMRMCNNIQDLSVLVPRGKARKLHLHIAFH